MKINDIKKLVNDKKPLIKRFLRYVIVGGIATLIEWVLFFLFNGILNIQYLLATSVAFLISTFFNWLFGRILVFKKSKRGNLNELIQIYIASIGGLMMNLIIMYLAVDLLEINEMISKIIATGIVFVFNYLIREKLIYKH